MHSRKRHRTGISLIEVLMSIFIISIGILGVAALLPLAEHMAARGLTADRAAIGGREALRQFNIREMNNPDNWLTAAGAAFDLAPHLSDAASNNYPLQPIGAKAYCLDPRGVASGVTGNLGGMQRITLRSESGGAAAGGTKMPATVADEIFKLQDDLHFSVPDDDDSPPVQKMLPDGGNEKRLTDGDYSWLATLVREGDGDRYTLSTVIVHKRTNPTAELSITTGLSIVGGVGGGDLLITTAPTGATAEALSPGRWVMLSSGNTHHWYRIIYTSGTKQELTLAGPDWDTNLTPQLTIIPGVVAVYERTIRLETSSLWGR